MKKTIKPKGQARKELKEISREMKAHTASLRAIGFMLEETDQRLWKLVHEQPGVNELENITFNHQASEIIGYEKED